jgi:hypothetical protein
MTWKYKKEKPDNDYCIWKYYQVFPDRQQSYHTF